MALKAPKTGPKMQPEAKPLWSSGTVLSYILCSSAGSGKAIAGEDGEAGELGKAPSQASLMPS